MDEAGEQLDVAMQVLRDHISRINSSIEDGVFNNELDIQNAKTASQIGVAGTEEFDASSRSNFRNTFR